MVHLTAKSTLFGNPTFASFCLEALGALPFKRAQDHQGADGKVDNSGVMSQLVQVRSNSFPPLLWGFVHAAIVQLLHATQMLDPNT